MGECDICSGDRYLSYNCNECGGTFCTAHRLPEDHDCEALKKKSSESWFKEAVSVRRNRPAGTDTGAEIEKDERVERKDEGTEAKASHLKNLRRCEKCGEQTYIKCEYCKESYCHKHFKPNSHDCSEKQSAEETTKDSELSPLNTDEPAPGTPPEGVDLTPRCETCGRITLRDCEFCGGEYCESHQDPAKHDCPEKTIENTRDGSLLTSVISVLTWPVRVLYLD